MTITRYLLASFVRDTAVVKLTGTKKGQRLGADEVVVIHTGPTVRLFASVHTHIGAR